MRVLVLGGYGVFGARLSRLLRRDGHAVCVAGRDGAAASLLASAIGASALQIDRTGDLSALSGFDAVVDAAGPFHTYGADPYRLAKAAIAARVHYLDLSDNAAFCQGITALDAVAKAAGVCVVSGLSSVPALSSAAVQALAAGDRVRVIDVAILPGNRSPRGLSVMHSIVAQAGRPMPVWHGNKWEQVPGWSDPATYTLPDGLRRQGWRIEVPDTRLFPAHFGAETVRFRAGLELGLMRYGLAAFGLVQAMLNLPVGLPLVRLFKLAAEALAPFGTDRGGMSVIVIAGGERRTWRLLAEAGDGPFIPAIAARALLRGPNLPPGAGPAIGVISLDEAEAAMADLKVRTERQTEVCVPLFARVLGHSFHDLPPEVRATHDTADCSRWRGQARVSRGGGLWPRLIAMLFGFPPAAEAVPVTVTKKVTRGGETWVRTFGARRLRSYLAATPEGMTERFGPITFLLALHVRDHALQFPVRGARLGPLALPRWMLPRSDAAESVVDGLFHFDVALSAPLTGALIVRYQGWLKPVEPDDPAQPGTEPRPLSRSARHGR